MASKENRGLARHFTNRRVKEAADLNRKASISLREKISGPVELIHTTNMLSYSAPDIHPHSASSNTNASFFKSDSDSEGGASPTTMSSTVSSPPTSPDVANPAYRTASPEVNHLSSYFVVPGSQSEVMAPSQPSPAPVVPQRAPSHTKHHSGVLVKKNSTSRLSGRSRGSVSTKGSFSFSRASTSSSAPSHVSSPSITSAKVVAPSPPPVPSPPIPPQRSPSFQQRNYNTSMEAVVENPFGAELEKVTEIAEEYGVKDKLNETQAEERLMKEKGLSKFKAEDYMMEIQGLMATLFSDVPRTTTAPGPMWI